MVHTGQHYDRAMSAVFFDELGLRAPDVDLGVGSGTHAEQTGLSMQRLEPVCRDIRPDVVLVYGDTNATLAGALVAAKMNIRLAHVEAGLRSFDRSMPEEVNRVLTDHVSSWLFCPTEVAVSNLRAEGIAEGVFNTGDVMYDAVLAFASKAREESQILDSLRLREGGFVLATIHRDFNTDNPQRLRAILDALNQMDCQVVLPAHPRLTKCMRAAGVPNPHRGSLRIVDPVGYLDMVRLEAAARVIVTDSGGVQKEAYFHRVPCVTVRPSTEWVETVAQGWNQLVDADEAGILSAVRNATPPSIPSGNPYGDGTSARRIAEIISKAR
jgi:UDP-GlcNAc3NAcA epimerase